MLRRMITLVLLVGLVVAISQPVQAAWWPFGKSEKKTESKAKPSAAKSKSTSWDWFATKTTTSKKTSSYINPYSGKPSAGYGKKKEPEKKSWFGSWFQPEEPKKVQSVGEFMALERPKP